MRYHLPNPLYLHLSPMAVHHSFISLLIISATILLSFKLGNSVETFIHSRAAYYADSDEHGTETGACGYGKFGATLNGGDVSAASDLYQDGAGCGACYQVRCIDSMYCSERGVNVVITDHGSSDRTDFILSRRAFRHLAQTPESDSALLNQGIVDIEYRRVSCNYQNKNITIRIDDNSTYPYYLAFIIWYQGGNQDIIAVQLCETHHYNCKLLDRSYGAVWTTTMVPSGPLSVRMLFGGSDEEERWVVPVNNIPANWTAGQAYDLGIQINNPNHNQTLPHSLP